MKMLKVLPFLALGLIACLICTGCGSSSNPAPKQLSIMSSNLPTGTMGTAYSAPAQAGGGTAPYTWSIASGTLPAGLSLSAGTGMISGMPTTIGTSTFTLEVTDSAATPAIATASLSITIEGVVSITTSSLPPGTVGVAYTATLAAAGGLTPYKWSISSGTLPAGLTLSSGGTITGTPSSGGSSSFKVQVSDAESTPATTTKSLSITIQSALAITTASLPAGTAGVGYSTTLTATGGVTPYSWTLLSGNLPLGLSLSTTGAISGAPTTTGTSTFTIQVSDAEATPQTATAQLSITVNTINITTQSLPAGTVNMPYSISLTAVGGVTPYVWTLSGTLPTGLKLSSAGVISGTPTATGTSTFTVQVADSEAPPATASAQLTLTISGGGDTGLLKGSYAWFLNGFSASSQWTIAGSFVADGNGNITSGVVDGNSVTGQPFSTTITGTYAITSNGLNTVTLQGQSWGPVTYAFVLTAEGNGRLIEYDDATGNGSRGSGVLRKQDPNAFALDQLSGGYVFGMTGADGSGARMANVGFFTLASGTISNGACDINDGGVYSTCTFTGTVAAVDPQTGRATVTVQSTHGTSHEAVYVVSASELVMEGIDSVPGTQTPLGVGPMLQQSGPFSNASLNGNAVMSFQDIHCGDGFDQSGAAIFSFDGSGTGNSIAMDEDLAGTITQDQPQQAAYSVQSNGALSFSCQGGGCPAGFVISQNKAFMVGTGCSSMFMSIEPQTGGPFSNASFQGSYVSGSLAPLDYANAGNELGVGSADGLGTLTLSGDSSSSDGLDQWFGTIVNYSIAADGRGTGQAQGDKAPSVVYVISPTKWIVLSANSDAAVYVFEH